MITSSTPTSTDALADRKRILDENAAYIARRDTARAECLRWEGVVEQAKRELANIEDLTKTALANGKGVEESLLSRRGEIEAQIVSMEGRLAVLESAESDALISLGMKEGEVDRLEAQLVELKREIGKHVVIAQEAHAGHERGTTEHSAVIEALDGQIRAKKDELDGMEAAQAAREGDLTEKEARLVQKEADLHILEARISKLAQDSGYPHKIQV